MMELSSLPEEMLINIFSFLSNQEIFKLRQVCFQWRDLLVHPSLWRMRSLIFSCNDSGMYHAALQLVPCIRSIDIPSKLCLDRHGLQLAITQCAATEVRLRMEAEDPILGALIIQNQINLGRLRNLYIFLDAENDSVERLVQFMRFVHAIEGLEVLELYKDNVSEHQKTPSTSVLPTCLLKASLRTLVWNFPMLNDWYFKQLEFQLHSNATTLVELIFGEKVHRLASLLTIIPSLVHLKMLDVGDEYLSDDLLDILPLHVDFLAGSAPLGCLHSWVHSNAVQRALQRNPRLHIVELYGPTCLRKNLCIGCATCERKACWTLWTENCTEDFTIGLSAHDPGDASCGQASKHVGSECPNRWLKL